jgi:hypothetical protein
MNDSRSPWTSSRGPVSRTLDGQSTAGEAYESIGVDGNHVVLAIGTRCGIRWRPCHVP